MREFEQKRKVRKILYSRTMIFVLFVVFIFLAHATWNVYQKERLSKRNLEQVAEESRRLQAREDSIRTSVNYLQTDKGVESEIRSKFRAVKAGEQVAIIINDEIKKDIQRVQKETFWMKIVNFFDIL